MPAQVTCPHCHQTAYLWSDETEAGVVCPRCRKNIELGAATAIQRGVSRTRAERQCPACGKHVDKVLRLCPYCDEELNPEIVEPIVNVNPSATQDEWQPTSRSYALSFLGIAGFVACLIGSLMYWRQTGDVSLLVVLGVIFFAVALFCVFVTCTDYDGAHKNFANKVILRTFIIWGIFTLIPLTLAAAILMLLLIGAVVRLFR